MKREAARSTYRLAVVMTASTTPPQKLSDNSVDRTNAYVIVTPARNEAVFIEHTIQSVICQTVPPLKWVIVSDGSTDATDTIVEKYAAIYKWIELLRMPKREERNFAGKVHAFNAGYDRVRHLPHRFLACMDADISFEPDYFAYLLVRPRVIRARIWEPHSAKGNVLRLSFRQPRTRSDPAVCSARVLRGHRWLRPGSRWWRRPLAVLTARMKGWKDSLFHREIVRHRQMGSAKHGPVVTNCCGEARLLLGQPSVVGRCRVLYQMTKRPWILGGV